MHLRIKKIVVYYPNGSEFKEYVVQTNIRSKNNLNNNIAFWEHYLKDATSLHFPERYHVKKGHTLNTCTLIIPDSLLDQLQAYCTSHRLFITDSLTAAVAVCLAPYLKNRNKMLMVNFVKSTRDTDLYDEAIGLFIRTDIIKINLNGSFDFLTLSRNVQKSIIETAVYQSCPIIVKLGCFLNNEWRKKRIVNTLGSCISWIYASMFPKYKLDHRVLRMFFRVFSAQNKDRFFIDINILNHFITNHNDTKLFATDLKPVKPHQSDKTVGKNILNVWFDRDSENRANLILSSNLTSPFLERLGKDIIERISSAVI